MEDDPSFASTNASAECTVADGTDAFNPAHKKEVQSRGLPRLQKLRRHHSVCEQRYERAHSKRLNDQRERTLFLHRSLNTKMEQQLSSDSDSTIIIKPTSADSDMNTSVPELRRTDSVILTRQMLGCPSISSSDISEEEYAPQTAEESDSSAESIIRHKKNVAVDSDASNSEDEDNTSVTDAASSAASSASLSSASLSSASLSSASLLSTKSSDKSRMKKNSTTEVGQNKYPQSDKGMSDEEMPPNIEVCVESHKITGASQTTRRKWTEAEIKAVEKTLMEYISSGKVPGKAECLKCIETSPLALKERRWEGVKFYVKNRIDALKRESVKRR
ncbi:uncharacterized protein LOC109203836 isoform X5 [Oreochromis niloticus]|uniref:uncharacterized protein LOC109203836 isoform X5 n=1 Tax=Oreochromis niloticus TaxID=8128 RepID=UPI00090503F1|nr:uncharacterized protein LOC109203836 isoform X5 [Oreochromis niloticus]